MPRDSWATTKSHERSPKSDKLSTEKSHSKDTVEPIKDPQRRSSLGVSSKTRNEKNKKEKELENQKIRSKSRETAGQRTENSSSRVPGSNVWKNNAKLNKSNSSKGKTSDDKEKRNEKSKNDQEKSKRLKSSKPIKESIIVKPESAQINSSASPNGRRHWDTEYIATDLAEEADKEIAIREDSPCEESAEEVDYDDDFEEYENDDFEDDVDEGGQEEEMEDTKLDLGNNKRKSAIERIQMEKEVAEVKNAMMRENSARHPRRQQQQHESTAESEKEAVHPKKPERAQSGRSYINFSTAKERHKTQVAAGKAAKRGDKLLGMIRLDVVTFDLFELPPVQYEAFMKTFGATNALQATCQTGDDNLDEEMQTDSFEILDKWTQKPPATISIGNIDDPELLVQAIKGVGGPNNHTNHAKSWEFVDHSNSMRLSKFLGSAAPALLTLLEEETFRRSGGELTGVAKNDVAFSEKVTLLNTNFSFLMQRPVTDVAFAPDQATVLLTAHGHVIPESESPDAMASNDLTDRTYLCVWNISHPSQPQKVLVASSEVCSCAFAPFKASMVFAGMVNGVLNAWDLREVTTMHQEVSREVLDEQQWIFRSSTFTTQSAEDGHGSKVTAVKSLPAPKEESGSSNFPSIVDEGGSSGLNAFQMVTTEERGVLIVWTVLDAQKDFEQHIGQAHWGTIRLVRSLVLDLFSLSSSTPSSLQAEINAFDVTFDPEDGSFFYVGTDNGIVFHGSIHQHHRPSPRAYKPEYDTLAASKSLAFCPYGEGYILVGSDDGSVRLHAVTNERPLISWPGTVDGQPICRILWSKSRPCVFIVLDSISRVHVWDLGAGDIYPAHTVQFEDMIVSMALNPDLRDARQKQLLALGLANGKVEVHHLKAEFKSDSEEACKKELGRFLHYVSII